ncbi:polysaccharide lyase family 8 super-sandwich domain-containing protein, partial [Dyadobacter sp.]|uniref:polysaccharide lyase family 8 super-sandwich domain-containing protein n=1 Tax=Dyadobacter sp. TaxID=1914288 RepID=UPI003F6EC6C4
ADNPVATTLNQCLLAGNVTVSDGKKITVLKTGEHQLEAADWVQHDGVAYLFTSPTKLHVSNTTATGTWRLINHHSWATDEEVKQDVFKVWLDHGRKPAGGTYEYIVVPGMQAAQIAAYRKQLPVRILANTPEIQAVQHAGLGVTQIVFYKSGTQKISDQLTITARNPCMVMVKTKGNAVQQITVSDPTEKLNSLELEVSKVLSTSSDLVKVSRGTAKGSTLLNFKLPAEGMAGQSVSQDFR